MDMEFNLLPWRQEKRQQKIKTNMSILFFAFLLGIILSVGYYFYLHLKYLDANNAVKILEQKSVSLSPQLKEREDLQKTIDIISTKIKTIISLQANRTSVVHMVEELSKANNQALFITGLGLGNEQPDVAEISGVAKDDTHIADLMTKLNQSEWYIDPEIVEITKMDQGEKSLDEEVKSFKIKSKLLFLGKKLGKKDE